MSSLLGNGGVLGLSWVCVVLLFFQNQVPAAAKVTFVVVGLGGAIYVAFAGPSWRGAQPSSSRAVGHISLLPVPFYVFMVTHAATTGNLTDAVVGFIGIVVVVTISRSSDIDLRRALSASLAVLVGVSVALSIFDSRYVVEGSRDFLPGMLDGRALGLLEHPNGLGQVSALLVLVGFGSRRRSLIALGVVGLLASGSKTSLVAIGAAVLIGLAMKLWGMGRSLLVKLAVLHLGIFVAGVLALADLFGLVSFPHLYIDASTRSLTNRTQIWQGLTSGDVPWSGLGGTGLAESLRSTTQVGSAHDVWLETYLRDGVIGIAALVIIVMAMIALAARSTRRVVSVMTIIVFLIEGVTESSPVMPYFIIFYLALLKVEARSDAGLDGGSGRSFLDQGEKSLR